MSWLSKITGVHLGNVGGPIGAAIGSIIPGVGTAIGGALGQGLGAVGHGDSLGSAALQGAGAYGVGKLASHIPGVSAAGEKLGGLPGIGAASDYLKSHGGVGSLLGAPGGGGVLGAASDFLTGNGGKNALGAAQAVNAAMLQSKANDYAKDAVGSVTNDYASRAPLRQAGQAAMLAPGAGIAAKIAAIPQGANPYAHPSVPQIGRAG